MESYRTVAAYAEDEFTEKRSRFLCAITPVSSAEEAAAFLAKRREIHYDARHTVYAYRLRGNIERYSDDGEPQGTGGQPVLEVLRRRELVDVCVAVTRYFGGVLLGAGGLTRAYANGAVLAVASAMIVTMQPCTLLRLRCGYPLYEPLQRLAQSVGAAVVDTDFGADVALTLRLGDESVPGFREAVREATGGSVAVEELGHEFGAV